MIIKLMTVTVCSCVCALLLESFLCIEVVVCLLKHRLIDCLHCCKSLIELTIGRGQGTDRGHFCHHP